MPASMLSLSRHTRLSLWTWSTVTSAHSSVTADILRFSPVHLADVSLLFLTCSCFWPMVGMYRAGIGPSLRAGSTELAAGLPCQSSRSLGDGAKLGRSGHERGEHGPTAAGPAVPGLRLWHRGPLTEHKRSFSSCLPFLGIPPEERGSRTGNSRWWRFKTWDQELVRKRLAFPFSNPQSAWR